jgi:DNA-directed RNA polymerase subunit RPC12/RpoP
MNEDKEYYWLFIEEPDEYYHYECEKCGKWLLPGVWDNGKNPIDEGFMFCPYCGANMKKL